MIELRQQLDKERSVRMMLEEQVRPGALLQPLPCPQRTPGLWGHCCSVLLRGFLAPGDSWGSMGPCLTPH